MAPEDNLVSQPATAAPTSETAPQNFFSRLIGVLFSPGEAFRGIGLAPHILVPLLALLILGGAFGYLFVHRVGAETLARKQMQPMIDRGWIPADKAEEAIQQAAASPTRAKVQSALNIGITNVVIALIIAGLLKLVTMLMGAENTFKGVFSMTLYSYLAVFLVQFVISVTLLYLKNPEDIDLANLVGSNLGAVLTMAMGKDALPRIVTAFASFIDVFYIWRIVLLSIGLAAVSRRMKTSTAAMFVGGLFLLFALIFSPLMSIFT